MPSDAQNKANRANAMRSTGPRTDEGKAASKLNALKHGILAKDVVLPNEDEVEFARLKDSLYTELQPVGELEALQADLTAGYAWRLRRVMNIEKGIFMREVYDKIAREAGADASRQVSYPDSDEAARDRLLLQGRGEPVIDDPVAYQAAIQRNKDARALLTGTDVALADAFIHDVSETDGLSKLARYEAHLQRSLLRALQELRILQAGRASVATSTTRAQPQLDGKENELTA